MILFYYLTCNSRQKKEKEMNAEIIIKKKDRRKIKK